MSEEYYIIVVVTLDTPFTMTQGPMLSVTCESTFMYELYWAGCYDVNVG